MMRKICGKGFSLIELMITLAILAILTAIALPSYSDHIMKAKRAEAKTALLNLAGQLERYYAINHTYTTATIGAGDTQTDVLGSNTTENNYYTLSITAQSATSYTIQAAPNGSLARDDILCGTYSLNSLGVKTVTGTDTVQQCW